MAFTIIPVFLLLGIGLFGSSLAVDYCALPTCLDKHIACNNKGVSNGTKLFLILTSSPAEL